MSEELNITVSENWLVRSLTPMAEQKRYSAFDIAFLMHKMNIQSLKAIDLDQGPELRHFVIDLCFDFPPVKTIFPIIDQTPDIGQRRAHVPPCIVELIRKLSEGESLLEAFESGVWNGDFVG